MVEERYLKAVGALTSDEIAALREKRVAVVGCGGIGGYALEFLSRVGIGRLTVIDGDRFVLSNLNRQLLSTEALIGQKKVQAAVERVHSVNSDVKVTAIPLYLDEENARQLLEGHDVVADALDNVQGRRVLARACASLRIPMVHAAINGWNAQIAVIMPDGRALKRLYPEKNPEESPYGNTTSLPFTPALAAAIQVAETTKVLLRRETSLENRLLLVDLLSQTYVTVKL